MTVPSAGMPEPIEQPWWPRQDARLGMALWTRKEAEVEARFLAITRVPSLLSARGRLDGVITWGLKPLGLMGVAFARFHRVPLWRMEDGLIRSIGLGKSGAPAWSMICDDIGLPIDARRPSRLERILAETDLSQLAGRAEDVQRLVLDHRLSKYNHAPDRPVAFPGRRRILLIDQVYGDWSIPAAGASAASFARMMDDALAIEGATVIVRGHPDVAAGYAKGFLARKLRRDAKVVMYAEPLSPHALIDAVDEVWTVSSQFGFDALLRGTPVVCYGMPFYAGWGLTEDRATGPVADAARRRRATVRRLTMQDLVAGALIVYPRYCLPEIGTRLTPEDAIERMGRLYREAQGR
jgi:capsular polysaccharide export protein